jgi:hypothetical protein
MPIVARADATVCSRARGQAERLPQRSRRAPFGGAHRIITSFGVAASRDRDVFDFARVFA